VDEQTINHLQDELRQDLLPWMLLPYALAGAVMVVLQRDAPPPPSVTALGVLLLLFAILVWALRHRHRLASLLLSWGGMGLITVAWHWFPASEAHHALLIPIIATSFLLGWQTTILTVILATGILTVGLTPIHANASPIPLAAHVTVLWTTAAVTIMVQHPQRRTIEWAWQGYERARVSLEQARDRQVELKLALEDLAQANSEAIRLNELLLSARSALEEARRAKEEFVANVSHELRTPLNMIIGFSDMILESPEVYARRLPAPLMADITAIRRNSTHLASLVDDVLELVESDVGHIQLSREWVDIGELVREAAEAVAALFEKKGLTLSVHIAPDLPTVHCDRIRIRQVILNLLSNAGRFTEIGGSEIHTEPADGQLLIRVADTGPGVDHSKVSHLFEAFQQGDPSIRRRYGGTGLGLAISKRFVEMHGGRIWLESELGVGTMVSFTLPVGPEANHAKETSRWFGAYQEYQPRTRPSQAPHLRPKARVVVLEKGHSIDSMMSRYLESLESLVVHTPEEAARAVERHAAVALVINESPATATSNMLHRLPPMASDVPIMACWVPERQAPLAHLGAQGYLLKPVSRSDLLRTIRDTAPEARTILLVDDDAEARQLFGRILASAEESYAVLYAPDGDMALRLLRERRPDLVLLDLVMPNGDGFTLLENKRCDPTIQDTPVIIVSAKDPESDPIVSGALMVTRQQGLSARDLMRALEAITGAVRPRFGAPATQERPDE
jgi:signal transduction histidine kinase/CheY-like chemotaxis protein